MADGTLKVGTITNSAGSGNIAIGSGVTLLSNTPAFFANLSAATSITDGTKTKIQFDEKVFDTDSVYDNSTNYRFTVPSGKAGKYFFNSKALLTIPEATSLFNRGEIFFYKNGAEAGKAITDNRTNYGTQYTINDSVVFDLDVSDYVEVYARLYVQGGTPTINGGSGYYHTTFSGYRIGA